MVATAAFLIISITIPSEYNNINITKVERIIDEFRTTLNFKYPVAHDFDRIYIYLERRLRECMVSKDKEIMEEIVMHLRSMRDNWKEVMKKAKSSEQ